MRCAKLQKNERRVRFILFASAAVLAGACASSRGRPARSPVPAAAAAAPNAAASAAHEAPVAPELDRLVRSVRALDDGARDPQHHRLNRSLRDAAAGFGAELVVAAVAMGDGTPRHDPTKLAAVYADIFATH